MNTKHPRRTDWVTLVILVLSAAYLAGLLVVRHYRDEHGHDEAPAFAEKYGPSKSSEGPEEWLIRDFFQDRRDGFFLDVGASHYQILSNTYYLEKALGWRGIAVDALTEFEADYRAHRPNTRFRAFFVSDKSDDLADIYYLNYGQASVSSGDKAFTERFGKNPQPRKVPTITLTDMLDREGVTAIDFLSMDIELWEPQALAGFDLARFRPALVCIEAHVEVREQILEYFTTRGYVIVGKYLRADHDNLYFRPLQPR